MEKIWIKDGKFAKLNKEQIGNLTDEQTTAYYAEYTENELKSVVSANEKQMNELKSEIAKMQESIKSMKIDELEANLEGVQNVVKNIRITHESAKAETVKEVLNKNFDKIKSLKKGDKMEFVVKTDVTRSSITDSTAALRLEPIGQLANPLPAIMDNMTVIQVANVEGKNTIRYFDTTSATRNAASISENGTFPESAITWQEYTLNLEKYGDSIPVTYEMMQDYPRFAAELDLLLRVNLKRKLNADLWSGNGVAPNIKGIYTYATAFNAGAYAGTTFADANLLDLFDVLKTQIMSGADDKYNPMTVFMSTNDY